MLLSEYGTFFLSLFACLVAMVPYTAYGIVKHTRNVRVVLDGHNLSLGITLIISLTTSLVFYFKAKEYIFHAELVYWIGVGIFTSFFAVMIEEVLKRHDDEHS